MRRAALVWAGLVLQAAGAVLAQSPEALPPAGARPVVGSAVAAPRSRGVYERSAGPLPTGPRAGSRAGGGMPPKAADAGAASAAGAAGAAGAKEGKPSGPQVTSFNPEAVELRAYGPRWVLVAGDKVLKDFGRYEAEGREAVRVIRQLKLDGYGAVGSPPVMEFWLAGGAAPQGPVVGAAAVAFEPATLVVVQDQGEWVLRDSQRVLFTFGPYADSAWDALRTIQQYGFGQVAMVGQSRPLMQVFLAGSGVVPAGFSTGAAGGMPGGPPVGLGAAGAMGRMAAPAGRSAGLTGGGSAGPMAVQASAAGLTHPEVQPAAPRFGSAATAVHPGAQPAEHPSRLGLTGLRVPGLPGSAVTGLGDLGTRVPFDSRQLQVRRDGGVWKLVLGPYALADFGANEGEARRARLALQHLRCTEQVLVGGTPPVFTYYLAGGRPPQGVPLGMAPVPFRPEALTVVAWQGQQVITDGSQILFSFADAAAAQQALRSIQQHGFDGLLRFGGAEAGLTLLIKSR